jgi:hypothetical protein
MVHLWTRPTTKNPLCKLAFWFVNINFNIFTFTPASSIFIVSSCWSIRTLYRFLLALMRATFFYFPLPWFGRPNDISQTVFMIFIPRTVLSLSKHMTVLPVLWVIDPLKYGQTCRYFLFATILTSVWSSTEKKLGYHLSVNSVSNNYSVWDFISYRLIWKYLPSFLLYVHSCTNQGDFCKMPSFAAEALQSQQTDKHSR